MTFTPGNKRLYDFFLQQLNANTYGVTFDGNFMFRFWAQGSGTHEFEILYKDAENTEDLNYLTKEVVPVVDISHIEIPFVERNIRSDFEKEFYIGIRIEATINEFNQRILEFKEDNVKYAALLEAIDNMRNTLTYTVDDYKYTVKIKEPRKVNVFKYNGDYYQLLAVNFNITSVKDGFFGNEMKFYLGTTQTQTLSEDYLLDNVETNLIIGKLTHVYDPKAANFYEQKTNINSRNWQGQFTINYRGFPGEELVWQELHLLNDTAVRTYTLRITQNDLDYNLNVVLTNINAIIRNNSIIRLTFTAERV